MERSLRLHVLSSAIRVQPRSSTVTQPLAFASDIAFIVAKIMGRSLFQVARNVKGATGHQRRRNRADLGARRQASKRRLGALSAFFASRKVDIPVAGPKMTRRMYPDGEDP